MTAVPAAIDALLLLLRTAPELADVRIFDGPPLQEPSEKCFAVIGWLPEDQPTVDLKEDPRLASSGSSLAIKGLAMAWGGDDDMAAVRNRSDITVETIRASLLKDPSMRGTVAWAHLTAGSYRQSRNNRGCEASWDFTVHVNAFSQP